MRTSGVAAAAAAILLQSQRVQASPVELAKKGFSAAPDLAGLLLSFLGFADSFFPEAETLW
jgi:hypothetical protein